MPLKYTTLNGGAKLVKRYRKGRCYAVVWSEDTTEKQMRSQMAQGDAHFYPFNETTNEFIWMPPRIPAARVWKR